jgi:hypothetical protein
MCCTILKTVQRFKVCFFLLKVCAEEEEVVLEANQELFQLLKNWMQNLMHMLTKLSKLSSIDVTIRGLLIFRDKFVRIKMCFKTVCCVTARMEV